MADDKPTVFGPKATEQIAKTVREVARREMNPRGHRGRWQWHGGGDSGNTAWATISESGKDDMYQTVTLYQSAAPDTFTTATCGGVDFEDMQHTLCNSLGSKTVLVPAGYKAGEAFLIKSSMCDHDGDWDGWIVVAGPRMRCAAEYPTEVECCPIEGLKFTAWKTIWFFGGAESTRTDPCEEA